jgi:hypothetical protein
VLSGNSTAQDFGALADMVLGTIAELPGYLERL